ncbi:MAG: 6-phosphofructokinase [Deltaproteobacteria bacterium]|nr:6-phosphofructokinase [Deltaproteobacteria bacterium]
MTCKAIGIITSGGDCAGLNAVVKGVGLTAAHHGIKALVIPNGYAGLYNLIEFDRLTELTVSRLEDVNVSLAGSEAGHSRVKISKISDPGKYDRIKAGLDKFGIDGLIISGGDDTGSVIVDLNSHGINCIHAPKTMDLDLNSYSVGGDSTINRISDFVRDLKTTGRTHNRIIVVEVFGRYAGHTAFRGGIASGADAILIPEIPVDFDELYKHMKEIYWRRILASDVHAGTYSIVVAEGMKDLIGGELYDESAGVDSFGHKKLAGAGKYVVQELQKRVRNDPETAELMKKSGMYVEGLYLIPEIRQVQPGHLVRSGGSSAYDVNFGLGAGAASVELLRAGRSGVSVVEIKGTDIRYQKTEELIKQRYVNLEEVKFFENMNVCFGRQRVDINHTFTEVTGIVDRIY